MFERICKPTSDIADVAETLKMAANVIDNVM